MINNIFKKRMSSLITTVLFAFLLFSCSNNNDKKQDTIYNKNFYTLYASYKALDIKHSEFYVYQDNYRVHWNWNSYYKDYEIRLSYFKIENNTIWLDSNDYVASVHYNYGDDIKSEIDSFKSKKQYIFDNLSMWGKYENDCVYEGFPWARMYITPTVAKNMGLTIIED